MIIFPHNLAKFDLDDDDDADDDHCWSTMRDRLYKLTWLSWKDHCLLVGAGNDEGIREMVFVSNSIALNPAMKIPNRIFSCDAYFESRENHYFLKPIRSCK